MLQPVEQFEFYFQGELVKWTFTEIYFVSQPDLRVKVTCQHKAFVETFGCTLTAADSVRTIFNLGKQKNPEFFRAMAESYMSLPY
jgi:hypothetical protein